MMTKYCQATVPLEMQQQHKCGPKSKRKRCFLNQCGQLVGANPFKCKGCRKEFCVKHRLRDDHACKKADEIDPNKRKVAKYLVSCKSYRKALSSNRWQCPLRKRSGANPSRAWGTSLNGWRRGRRWRRPRKKKLWRQSNRPRTRQTLLIKSLRWGAHTQISGDSWRKNVDALFQIFVQKAFERNTIKMFFSCTTGVRHA